MNSTIEDRLLINLDKALDEGRKVLIRACKLLLRGIPVADKFIGLSNLEKKRLYFSPEQIKIVESGCKLEDMDTSLLHVIIGAFGCIGPGQLQDDLKQLKVNRNNQAHDRHKLSLNKSLLKSKLAELNTLYKSILSGLKSHCNPAEICLLDNDVANMETQLESLKKTLDDHIVEKTHALVRATVKAVEVSNQTTSDLESKISKVTSTLDEVTSKLQQITLSHDPTSSKDSINGQHLPTTDNSLVIEYKETILNYLSTVHQQVHINAIVKALGLGLKSKSQINSTLYELLKENSIQKVSESPPLWQALAKEECLSIQNEEHLTSGDCRVLSILMQSHEPMKPLNLAKNTGLSKLEINSLLYNMQKRGLVEKMKETPPLWQILESGRKALQECTSNDN